MDDDLREPSRNVEGSIESRAIEIVVVVGKMSKARPDIYIVVYVSKYLGELSRI